MPWPNVIGCWLAQVCAAVLWVKSWNWLDEGSPSNLLRRVQKEHVQLVKAPSASTSSTSITFLFGIIQYAHCQQTLRPHYRCLRQLSTSWAEIHLRTSNVQKHECRTQIWKLCNTSREFVKKDTRISNKAAAKIDHIKEYQCPNVQCPMSQCAWNIMNIMSTKKVKPGAMTMPKREERDPSPKMASHPKALSVSWSGSFLKPDQSQPQVWTVQVWNCPSATTEVEILNLGNVEIFRVWHVFNVFWILKVLAFVKNG